MTFSEAVKTCLLVKYVKFSGRASRAEYWYFTLFIVLVVFVDILVLTYAPSNIHSSRSPLFFIVIGWLVGSTLGLLLPGVGVSVRRLYDLDHSGWWYLITLIPYVGGVAHLALLILFCSPGTLGKNRFGEDPLFSEVDRLVQQF